MKEEELIKKVLEKAGPEYYEIVQVILENEEFLKRREYHHHEERSLFAHSILVSTMSYRIAKKLKWDYRAAAIGGLLHDFYYDDWQVVKRKSSFFQLHGFTHAREAVYQSQQIFPQLMNKRIENIIKRHMFPLNIAPPRYKESWLITLFDKYCSLEVFKYPKAWKRYIGMGR